MTLEVASLADAAGMAAAHALCFADPWSAGDIATLLCGPGVYGLLVRGGDSIEAFAVARAVADEAEILTLAVKPGLRRQGLGAGLVEAVALHAAGAGARRLFLEVAADNEAAIGLYRGVGFAQIGDRPAYYRRAGDPADALVFARDLNRPPA